MLITVSRDSHAVISERNIAAQQMGHSTDTHQRVIELTRNISLDEIKLVIERKFDFNSALEALEKTETRHARGKLTVNV